MRVAALLLLASVACEAAPRVFDRGCDVTSRRSDRGGVACSAPTGDFLFATGTGMGAVCSGTNPTTAATGQTVTYATRTGVRSCMKGSETTGIVNGDLVKLAADQYAVQPGGDGTGALGVSVWAARTNVALRSEEFSNATWVKFGDGVAAPTVTADTAVAPDGTTTADRIQFAATPTNEQSIVFQSGGCTTSTTSAASFFVKGNVGSGTIDIAINDGASWLTKTCAFNSTTWTRCLAENMILDSGATILLSIGNSAGTNGGVARPAIDVSVWGAQCEVGAKASPYIPTVAATASRGVERVTAPYTAAGSSVSLSATFAYDSTSADNSAILSMSFDANNETSLTTLGAKDRCDFNIAGVHAYLDGKNNMLTPVTQAAACTYGASSRSACAGSECKPLAGALTLPTGAATIYIGGLADGGTADGTVKGVCADPLAATCRPSGATTVACPYAATESQKVAVVGDSIMVGAYATKVADVMNDELCLDSKAVDQFAESGATIADCVTQYEANVKGGTYAYVATNCGTNSLSAGDPTGAATWAAMESLLNSITSDGGFHVIVGNITPCGGYGGCVTSAVTGFNALEAAWCADAGSRATCLDNFTLLGASSEPLIYSPTRPTKMGSLCLPSSDSLHPNNYCTTKLAKAFADAVP